MTETIETVKVGDCYKLALHSQNAMVLPDNTFRFNVDMKDIEGEIVRCGMKKIRYNPPATYTPRRLYLADGNTFFRTYTDPQTDPPGQKVNEYPELYAKYGNNNFMYMYYPLRNIYMRLFWNATASGIVCQTVFSVSLDGINWSANGNLSNFGMVINVDWSGAANVPFDFFEIDPATLPLGTIMQNIHCPQLRASQSYDTVTKGNSDIIGNIGKDESTNPYVVNDVTFTVQDKDCNHEFVGNALRGMKTLDIYFSRVATPTAKESVLLPWFIELVFYTIH